MISLKQVVRLSFPISASDAKSFIVPIIADSVQESTEAFAINFAVTDGSARIQHTQVIVLITDDDEAGTVPKISIEAPVSVVEGEMIAATLVTSKTIGTGETISVELTITENSGTFLDPNFATRSFDMTSARNMEPIMIPTRKHVGTADGEIELAVVRGNNYEPDSVNGSTAIVAIQEEDLLPKVTIALPTGAPTTIDEGEEIQFVLSASAVTPAPSSPITVHVQMIDDDTSDFLTPAQTTNNREFPVTSGGTYTFYVSTIADTVDEADGSITAMIITDPNQTDPTKKTTYLRGATENVSAVVMINDIDNASLPSIEISAIKGSINEGEAAEFMITASNVRADVFGVQVRFFGGWWGFSLHEILSY